MKSFFLMLRVCLGGLILFGTSFTVRAQNSAEAELLQIMKEYEAVGLSVAVVKNNKIIYTNSFGLKDIEGNVPLSDHDIFRIASISKSFSATSIMQLIEAKKVSLDDDFSDLIGFKVRNPLYPETVITLRMVLSHTSSINDNQKYSSLDIINPAVSKDWEKCYNNYEPGEGYEYCNLNFNMVGAVIERLSGERFDNYVKQHILNPLGLYGGFCVDSLDSKRFVSLYRHDAETGEFNKSTVAYLSVNKKLKKYILGYNAPIFSPTGGMKISATDLAKYMMMHMNYGISNGVKIISEASSKQMQKRIAEDIDYGLALRITDELIPGKTMKGHTGSASGLFSAMFFHPEEKFGIVLITNGAKRMKTGEFNSLIMPITQSLYNSFIK